MKKVLIVSVLCIGLIVPGASSAFNQARDYIPAAPGCLAVLLYYTHLSADSLYNNGNKIANDVDFTGNIGLFRPVYYMEVGPFEIDPQIIVPFGNLSLESNKLGADLSASGVGDINILGTIWLVNNSKEKTWLGFTPFFILPTGNYSNDGALSIGANRWAFREEVGFVKGFEVMPGHNAYFELTLGGDFFMDNDDFTPAGLTLSQDPTLNVETHLSYDVTDAFFISADYYYQWGGETSVEGVAQKDRLSNSTIGFTLAYNIASNYQLMFQYRNDFDVRAGIPQQAVLFRFLYACDVGYLFGKPALPKQ